MLGKNRKTVWARAQFSVLQVLVVIAACSVFVSIGVRAVEPARGEEKKMEEARVPAISLPFPPFFPFQQKPKPVAELTRVFAAAKAGSTVECDLVFAAKGFGEGANAFGKFALKKGTATLYTEHGYVKYLPDGVDVKPSKDKKLMKFGNRKCGFRFLRGAPSATSWIALDGDSFAADQFVPDYTTLAMPLRKEGDSWKVRLRVLLSPDCDGTITWWVDVPAK